MLRENPIGKTDNEFRVTAYDHRLNNFTIFERYISKVKIYFSEIFTNCSKCDNMIQSRKGGVAMLSAFGRYMRILRMDRGLLLKDVSEVLGVSASYLSAVETGRRSVPSSWRNEIIEEYHLSSDDIEELDNAIAESMLEVKFDIANMESAINKELILSFARNLDTMNPEKIARLMEIVKSEE